MSAERYCGNCRNGYPGTPVQNCTRCNEASGWEAITSADVDRLRAGRELAVAWPLKPCQDMGAPRAHTPGVPGLDGGQQG